MQVICEEVKRDADAFVAEAPQFDDITMLALKYVGKQNET
jgi:serine phosphatase RsbU (regulator of sigma subunit)